MQQTTNNIIKVLKTQEGKRLDVFLSNTLPMFSRSKIQELIKSSNVYIFTNNKWEVINNISYKVKINNEFKVQEPEIKSNYEIEPVKIDLDILYEDEHLMVINKPKGLTVHPGAGNKNYTLVNALVYKLQNNLSKNSGIDRPGIVHRLDKDTSGVMVIAKTDFVHHKLSEQFSTHSIKRNYKALVFGVVTPTSGEINNIIGRSNTNRQKMAVLENEARGKRAITLYKTLKVFFNGKISLLDCELKTGRTHQIRVHFSSLNHPLLGDETYGGLKTKFLKGLQDNIQQEIKKLKGQALHAYRLEFVHPITLKTLNFTFEDKIINNLVKLFEINS